MRCESKSLGQCLDKEKLFSWQKKEQQAAQVAKPMSELQQQGLRQTELLQREDRMKREMLETLRGEMLIVLVEAVNSQRTQEAQVANQAPFSNLKRAFLR